jgi:hypothetical protein
VWIGWLVLLAPVVALARPARVHPIVVLGDLDVQVPDDLAFDSRVGDDQMRYRLARDGVQFRMVAYETFARKGADFKSGVVADLATQGETLARARVAPLAVAKPLEAFEVMPRVLRSPSDTWTIVYAAYIARPTGGVQVLAFYVNEDGVADTAAWVALSRRIAQSVSGTDRERHPPIPIGRLSIDVPDGYAQSLETDGEALAYTLHGIVSLGRPEASCRLAHGTLPSLPDGVVATHVEQTILGHPQVWDEWSDREGVHATTLIRRPAAELAVTCRAATRDELRSLRTVIGTLRLLR